MHSLTLVWNWASAVDCIFPNRGSILLFLWRHASFRILALQRPPPSTHWPSPFPVQERCIQLNHDTICNWHTGPHEWPTWIRWRPWRRRDEQLSISRSRCHCGGRVPKAHTCSQGPLQTGLLLSHVTHLREDLPSGNTYDLKPKESYSFQHLPHFRHP